MGTIRVMAAAALAVSTAGCGASLDRGPSTGGPPPASAEGEEGSMTTGKNQVDGDAALRKELAGIWTKVRQAFADYRLDDALAYLDIPQDATRPSREMAKSLAEFLPDIDRARILDFKREGDLAAIFAETSTDPGQMEASVFRFKRVDGRWKVYPSPYSCSSVSKEKTDEAGLRKLFDEEPTLRLIPQE